MKHMVVGLIAFFLVSCSGTSYQTPSSGHVETSIPTATEAIEPVEVTTKTSLPRTKTPEATPIVVPPIDDLPAWLKDSSPNVLAALITDDLKGIRDVAFFNVATGERYAIPMPKGTSGFFWYDSMNFGFLSKDLKTAYHIKFESGEILTEAISPQSTRLLNKDWVNGLVMFKESNNEFVFDRAILSNASKNKSFTAEWGGDQNTVVVTDTKTSQVIWESDEIENVWVTDFIWSPIDDSHLAFLQGSPQVIAGYASDYITENIVLTIVNVTSGEIISSYSGDFGGLSWSPDGKKILYQDPMVFYSNYGYSFQDAPCLLFLATGEKRCLRAIPRLVPEGYKLETTRNYKWGINSETVFYTYVYASQLEEEKTLGNLCMYSLVTSYITCPTQNLEVLHGQSVGLYDISPNQEYIYFCYWNDNADTANDGVIKFDGTGFFSWTGAIQNQGPTVCSFDILWRPLP